MTEKQAYRKARKFAERLGCEIEIERHGRPGDQTITYWVSGPEEIYGWRENILGYKLEPLRTDPREGNHAAAGWVEALDMLEDYRQDLLLHDVGIDDDLTWTLEEDERLRPLLYHWMEDPDDAPRLGVLGDFMEEHGIGDQPRKGHELTQLETARRAVEMIRKQHENGRSVWRDLTWGRVWEKP